MRTPQDEHDRLAEIATQCDWTPPPRRPVQGECCERNCEPCVWDYYERALRRWRKKNGLADDA